MNLLKYNIFKEIDKFIALALMGASLILIIYLTAKFGQLTYSLVGLLSLLPSVIWLFIRKNRSFNIDTYDRDIYKYAYLSFYFVYITNLILYIFRPDIYMRPLIYFILMSFLSGILFICIIFSKKEDVILLLFAILLFGITHIISESLLYPTVLGIDPWWHQYFASKIIETGSIPANKAYSMLPIFHVLISQTSLLAALDYKMSSILAIGFSQISIIAFIIFMIAKFLFNDYKISLLSSLCVSIANQNIMMSLFPIPNGLGNIFVFIIIYILLKKGSSCKMRISLTILQLVFMFALIMTHPLASASLLIILIISYITIFILDIINNAKSEKIKSLYLINIVTFFVITIAWWIYASNTFSNLAYAIKWGFSVDRFISVPSGFLISSAASQSEKIFNQIGMILFFSISFIGLFYMISNRKDNFSCAIATSGFAMLSIGFIPFITGISFIEQRWIYISQIILSIPLAAAFLILVNTFKTKFMGITILSFFFMVMTFVMVMSNSANIDNPFFSQDSQIRLALIESEVQASSRMIQLWDGKIGTDQYYGTRESLWDNRPIEDISGSIYTRSFSNNSGSLVLIRNEIVQNAFLLFTKNYKIDYDILGVFNSNKFLRIYDNNQICGWIV